MSPSGTLETESLTPLHWLAIAMALVSAGVHLFIAVDVLLPSQLGYAFLFATGGFVGAVILVLVDYRRRLIYALGIPFTAGQIVLWFLLNDIDGLGAISAVDAVDKIAQVILIAALVVLFGREA